MSSNKVRLSQLSLDEFAVTCLSQIKPQSASSGRFLQLLTAVVRQKVKYGVVHAIQAWLKYVTTLSGVV